MNYIRGAVSAISAPYQYYRDLPPINPATLTGAIDVIVVERPTADKGTELVCSPFHVRFGKWQVLRPGEKKVKVMVNGQPIPFDMKIGEAGEAFFVFETDDDVPEDLITSPLLQPTRPEDTQAADVPTDRFGAKQDPEEAATQDIPSTERTDSPIGEPEFLDLDARPDSRKRPSDIVMPSVAPGVPFPGSASGYDEQDKAVLSRNVEYKHDVAIDGEGYHSQPKHDRERTITADENGHYASPPASPSKEKSHPHGMDYSWEWGAFPQPSPMQASFGDNIPGPSKVPHRSATGSRMSKLNTATDGDETDDDVSGARSRSVPPAGSPSRSRRKLRDDDVEDVLPSPSVDPGFGSGGRLSALAADPTHLTVAIEGKKIPFELSIIKNRERQPFDRHNEVDAARQFAKGKIDLHRLLEDDTAVKDPSLVIRWNEDQYIIRADGSPLMDALVLWRDALLAETANGMMLRPTSPPLSDVEEDTTPIAEEEEEQKRHYRAKSEPPESTPKPKPTSSSWVQWWGRSKREDAHRDDRPRLPWTASEPNPNDLKVTPPKRSATDVPPADSAPEPSTPVQRPTQLPLQPSPENAGKRKYVKTLRLTSDQLKTLKLKPGPNSITFSLSATGAVACTARIFVWDSMDTVLISDIDGTITKSDGLGHVFAMIGRDWTHLGVAKLYTDIIRNGYKIMYLTSRAIGQADATRDYLKGIKQNDYQLPEGPVIMSPDRLMASLHREVIMRKPEVFKMACLRDIQRLFGEGRNPFYAGFGNRITDALSYRSVNVPSSRIFTIDSSGEVKLELLELAGYKSSYIHMTDLVDQIFPPIHRKWTEEYTDFNFWKAPVQEFALPDLSPPSPALSARSETSSTMARIRNFSLVPSRQSTANARQGTLRQVSRDNSPPLSSSHGSRRSASPESRTSSSTFADSDDDEIDFDSKQARRMRRTSMTSMPGSLDDDDLQFDLEDDHEFEYDDDLEHDEQDEDEALEQDLLAAGEMKNVPFL